MPKRVVTSFTTLAIGILIGISVVELYYIETQTEKDQPGDAVKNVQALGTPPIADERNNAVEVLRVWTVENGPNQFVVEPFWEDAGAWGILLADIARHSANAHAEKHGGDPSMALSKIVELLFAELEHPSSPAEQIRIK